jgi:Uma2 family endonuclease
MSIGARVSYLDSDSAGVPPLEQGDRLTRDEFERRYDAMPELKKAELIEGVVYIMPPAVRWENHATPHADLVACLVFYRGATPGVRVGDNGSIRLDLDNEPQPDAAMIIDPALGGQATISDDDYVEGAPELVAEVSASTKSLDLNAKLRVYRRNGVREYIVWRVHDKVIDWFVLRHGNYEAIPAPSDGIHRSEVFPGLWLDAAALMRGDVAKVLGVLQQGMQSPEHSAFVALLQSRGPATPDEGATEA